MYSEGYSQGISPWEIRGSRDQSELWTQSPRVAVLLLGARAVVIREFLVSCGHAVFFHGERFMQGSEQKKTFNAFSFIRTKVARSTLFLILRWIPTAWPSHVSKVLQ